MKVLIGYDGSPGADVAIELAASLPWPDGSTLRVITAVDAASFETIYFPVGPQDLGPMIEKQRRVAEERSTTAAQELERDGLTVEHAVLAGRPSRVLAAEAELMHADLIIVGNAGQHALATTLVGSVSSETIDRATVPVLVARAPTIRHLLAADDGSDAAAQAINCVVRWPVLRAMPVEVLSVVPQVGHWGFTASDRSSGEAGDPGRAHADRVEHVRIAEQTARRLQACGHPADWLVANGQVANEIVHTAAEQQTDLIVMGTRGNTGLERFLTGSVSRRVVTHAGCSILIAHAPRLN